MTIIEQLKKGDEATMKALYLEHKQGFLAFAQKYNLPQDEVNDVYQDAFVALVENAMKGKIDHLKVQIKTYLFAIGKYMIYSRLKTKTVPLSGLEGWDETHEIEEIDAKDEKLQLMERAFKSLGEQCYSILNLFYYQEKSLDEILLVTTYQSKDVLKTQKSRCIKQLRDLMIKQ